MKKNYFKISDFSKKSPYITGVYRYNGKIWLKLFEGSYYNQRELVFLRFMKKFYNKKFDMNLLTNKRILNHIKIYKNSKKDVKVSNTYKVLKDWITFLWDDIIEPIGTFLDKYIVDIDWNCFFGLYGNSVFLLVHLRHFSLRMWKNNDYKRSLFLVTLVWLYFILCTLIISIVHWILIYFGVLFLLCLFFLFFKFVCITYAFVNFLFENDLQNLLKLFFYKIITTKLLFGIIGFLFFLVYFFFIELNLKEEKNKFLIDFKEFFEDFFSNREIPRFYSWYFHWVIYSFSFLVARETVGIWRIFHPIK